MHRRTTLATLALPMLPRPADASHPQLASNYARHAVLVDDIVYGWDGAEPPRCCAAAWRAWLRGHRD